MLFNCALLAAGLCNLTNTPYEINGSAISSYQYSKWKISNCTPQQTQIVITNLDWMSQLLPYVNKAVRRSTTIAPYRIFFKSTRQLPLVKRVFASITRGEEVDVDTFYDATQTSPPEFFCATSDDFTDSFLENCVKEDLDASRFKDEPFVMLCPKFWDRLWPASDKNVTKPVCPSLAGKSGFLDDESMLLSKVAIIIHELAHLYTRTQVTPERYTMQECAALTAAEAVRNANNYTFYAMSKFSSL
jgi:hypothetical protein